eukprot:8220103-Pyramimonas_sp.AAC.1
MGDAIDKLRDVRARAERFRQSLALSNADEDEDANEAWDEPEKSVNDEHDIVDPVQAEEASREQGAQIVLEPVAESSLPLSQAAGEANVAALTDGRKTKDDASYGKIQQ